jgi:leucyl/phenylalanyl-tRNA--protein transferase
VIPDWRADWLAREPPREPIATHWDFPARGPDDDSGVVAVGADLEPGTLLAAYRSGMFPMPLRGRDLAWFSPDPRGIIPLDGLHISRSLRRTLERFSVTIDRRFTEVMSRCGDPSRPGHWITPTFIDAYRALHDLGWAHSLEVWSDDELVGGLYGVRIGGFFAGESMFHSATDASKVALVHTVEWLNTTGGRLFDVQWTTPHLVSMGAIDITRDDYLQRLAAALRSSGDDPGDGHQVAVGV